MWGFRFLQPFGSLLDNERTTHAQASFAWALSQAEDAVVAGPIHENGLLKRIHGRRKRFRGGGGRPVFGLWAAYSATASRR